MSEDRFALVASRAHTVRYVAVWAVVTTIMTAQALRPAVTAPRSHVVQYLILIAIEWALFWFARAGLRAHGTPIASIVDAADRPQRHPLATAAIGVAFWLGGGLVLVGVKRLIAMWSPGQHAEELRTIAMFAPHGALEVALWIALSLSAGICEEFVFRGYLQRQFTALARRGSIGIIASALLFGVGHSYQGWRSVVTITVFGLMFGWLAHASRSLRPGMLAHALQDMVSGLIPH